MDIEHPDISRMRKHGYLPEDEHYDDSPISIEDLDERIEEGEE